MNVEYFCHITPEVVVILVFLSFLSVVDALNNLDLSNFKAIADF